MTEQDMRLECLKLAIHSCATWNPQTGAAAIVDTAKQYFNFLTENASPPDWEDLRGCAPDATGTLSSEAFVRKIRDSWE